MAKRGTVLPFAVRQEIKRRVMDGEAKAAVARALGISRPTVRKWSR